jgi:hypothetical protein
MFRVLSRLLVALFALMAMRLFFASARRVNQRSARSPKPPPAPLRAPTPHEPRIDRASAEDVSFVELEPERTARK